MLKIQIGLLSIPISTTNFSNSRYASSSLHQFSICCKDEVGNKPYCKSCGKEVNKEEILKGTDKDTLLSKEQQNALKNALEGGLMEVLGIKEINETTTYDILPYIEKAQLVLPSLSKGYKKVDIKTFYSFKNALKELNKLCMVKLTQRATEHIGILLNWKEDLIWLELPFKHYNNSSEIDSDREMIVSTIQKENITDLNAFTDQAKIFINSFKGKVGEISEIDENKATLLKTFVEEIKSGIINKAPEIQKEESNPFAI